LETKAYPIVFAFLALILSASKWAPAGSQSITPPFIHSAISIQPGGITVATAAPDMTLTPDVTPTPGLAFPPASQYRPLKSDFSKIYQPEGDLREDNLAMQASLPIAAEYCAAACFKNNSRRGLTNPQEGPYIRFKCWVFDRTDLKTASVFYQKSTSDGSVKQVFLSIMPAVMTKPINQIDEIDLKGSPCDDGGYIRVFSNVYGKREGGTICAAPQDDFREYFVPERTAQALTLDKLPPDLYFHAPCRVNTGLIAFGGYAADIYDAKNSPIPEDIFAEQANQFLEKISKKVKAAAS